MANFMLTTQDSADQGVIVGETLRATEVSQRWHRRNEGTAYVYGGKGVFNSRLVRRPARAGQPQFLENVWQAAKHDTDKEYSRMHGIWPGWPWGLASWSTQHSTSRNAQAPFWT